ncbi:MAG: glycosyltransferase family 9 protein [Endomicrobium sp.]|nr:glycosyltransferase family 9 protein [Endomicrobium sp.]
MDKIVFFHMNQLGDLLFSLPALKAAKQEPNSKIYSVVNSNLSPLLVSAGLVDGIIPKNDLSVKIIKKENFDKAVLFSESPNSLITAFLSGVKERVGFNTASLSFLLTEKAQRLGVPSLSNNRALGLKAGLKTIESDYANILNIPKENLSNVQNWFKSNHLNVAKTIAVSVGASKKRRDKCLDESKWIEVINILFEKGFDCVLSGAEWEKETLTKIAEKCRIKPALFTAENGILDSAAFLKKSNLFIGIDSGAMHLAAALGTKCIAVFGYTDPGQVGPMPLENHIVIKKDSISQVYPEDIVARVIQKMSKG